MTRAEMEARALEVRALDMPGSADKLDLAPLPCLLLWGLSDGDPYAAIGVLGGVRLDLDVLAACIDTDRDTLGAGIRAAARRLDVAMELLRRVRRGERAAAADKDGAP